MNVDQELDALLNESVTPEEAILAEELLADLSSEPSEIALDEPESSTETIVEPEEHQIEALSDKELGISKTELYEAQESMVGVASEEDAAPVKNSKQTRAPRVSATKDEDGNPLTRSAILKRKADVTGLSNIGYEADEVEAIMAAIDAAPVKVGEKASNLLRYGLGRDHVSNFTRFALSKLRSAENMEMTVPELVKAMMDERGYTPGTARSQSQQMSRLFGIFGMVSKDGSKMTLDPTNRLTASILKRLDGEPGWARPSTLIENALSEDETGDGEQVSAVESLSDTEEPATETAAPETHAEKSRKRRDKKAGAQKDADLLAA